MEHQTHNHNHQHDHNHGHDHSHKGHDSEVMQAGDNAIQSAFSVGLFLLKGLIIVVALGWFFSGIYNVNNGENAVEMFLGKIKTYNGKNVRSAGMYFSLPFPFTEVIKLPVNKEINVSIDDIPMNPNAMSETADDPLVKGQSNYYVTKDMNLLHLGLIINCRIKELDKFIILFYEPGDINKGSGNDKPWVVNCRDLISNLSRAVMMEECSKQNFMDVLTGKNVFNQEIKERVQDLLDKMGTGIEVTNLNLVKASPPISVTQSFFEVLNAKQRKIQAITESQKKKEEILLEINSEVKKIEFESQNEIVELEQSLKSEASRVQTISQLFKDNPNGLKNYLHQQYLEVVSEIMANKSIEFVNQPDNAIFRTSIFEKNKNNIETGK